MREIVLSEVINVTSRKRPLMSLIGSETAEALFFERLEDTLASRGHNAVLEGAQHTAPNLTQPSRLQFIVQRFAEWGEVTDEQRDTAHYTQDPFSYQVAKNMEEMLNDIEHTLQRGSAVTGNTDSPRQLEGLLNVFPGQTTFTTDASGTTFSEKVFIDGLQVFNDQSYDVDINTAIVNSWLKRTISEFSTKVTRNVDASQKMQTLVVERHSSDFGDVDVFYSEDQLKASSATEQGNSIIYLDRGNFNVAWFKMPTVEALTREGFSDRFQETAQCTLTYGTKKAGGGGLGYVANITTD
jgi:hypothetical protein